MTYNDARYRAAIRRARRVSRRYGHHMTWWQKAGLAIAAVVVLSGAVKATAHSVSALAAPAQATASASAPSGAADAAVAFARARIGCPYVYGATGPCSAGYDCSGLVMEAYASAGVTIGRTSEEQWATLRHVTSPHRGDLVFFTGSPVDPPPGHVGIVVRPGIMIDAYDTGTPVREETYGLPSSAEGLQDPVGFARPVALSATLTAAGSYTPGSWARALLHGGGWQATSCNVAAVIAWEAAEGGHWHNKARYNPLNDKLPEPGSKNAVGKVQAYTSWAQGLRATLASLGGPDYGQIRSALMAGNNAAPVAAAISASVWGTETFTAEC